MKRIKTSKVFKIGDNVKILIPETVKRVGYPLCLNDVRDEVDKHTQKISSFLLDIDAPWYNSRVIK